MDKDGCQHSKRSALSLTVGYLECATTPETSEKLKETVYITCARLGRCSKFDIAATKWRPHELVYKRSYGGSREDAGHLSVSTLVALHRLMSVIVFLCVARSRNVLLYIEITVVDLHYLYAFLFSRFFNSFFSNITN